MTNAAAEALSRATEREAEITAVLQRWVDANSYSASVDGVNAVGALLEEDFRLPGLSLERCPGRGVGDHLMWRTPAWDAAGPRRLALVGHHDTVFPPGTFEGMRRDGDLLRGPGVIDMKGGLATVWAALASLADVGALAELPVALFSVGDEEIGSPDSRRFVTEKCRGAGAALVFEAGRAGDAIITRRKGTGGITAVATGRAAHAGNHHRDGVNAIWAVAQLVDAAQRLTDYDRGITVNVGLINGGEARNTVPGRAECGIDFRFERAEDGRQVAADIARAARDIAGALGAEVTLEGGVRRAPLERSVASLALCRRYAACAGEEGLGGAEADLIGGGSDASTVSAAGVPAIDGLGPRGKGFHTHDEQIEAASLLLRARALIRFLVSWGANSQLDADV